MEDHLEYAREQLRTARQLWDEADEEILTPANNPINTIIDCQRSIEISVKGHCLVNDLSWRSII
jgi:hypothetical protein